MTIPNAARTLIEQVRDIDPEVQWEASEEDGFAVDRKVTFTKVTFPLGDALIACDDPRIADVDKLNKKAVAVTFVGDSRADWRQRFALADALDILIEQD